MKMAKSLRLLCVIGLISTFWVGIWSVPTAEKKPVQTVVVSDCSLVGDLKNGEFVKAGSVSLCDKDSTKIPESSLLCIAVRNLTSSLCKLPPKESAIRASISDEDVTATCQKMVPVMIQTAPKEILVNVVNVTVTTQLSSKDTCEKLCEKSSLLCSFVYEGISRLVIKTQGKTKGTNTKPAIDNTQSVDHVDDPSTETKGQNNPTENKETLKTGEQKEPQKPTKTEKPQTSGENKEPQTPDANKEPQQPENEEHNEPQTLDENKELQKPDNEEHKEPLKPDNEEHKEPQTLDENKGPLKPDNEHKEPQTLDENKELQKPDENKGLQKPENEEHKEPQTPDENKGPQKPEDIKNKEAKKPKVDEEDLEEQYIDHSIKNSGDISPDYNKDENDQGESVGLQEISDTSDGNPDDEDVNEEVAPVPPEEDFGDIAVGGVKTHYAVGVDPDDGNSHFFVYFITIVGMSAILYIVFHNKKKILALILEGRNNRGRRPNSAQYRKLDNNLDEVIAGSTKKVNTGNIIY